MDKVLDEITHVTGINKEEPNIITLIVEKGIWLYSNGERSTSQANSTRVSSL